MGNDAETISRFKQLISCETDEQYDEAIGTALLIEDVEDRALYLLDAARSLLSRGAWRRAHGISELMPDRYEKAQLLREVGDHLASVGQIDRALPVYGEAESASLESSLSKWQQAELLNQIANSLSRWNAKIKADEVRSRAASVAKEGQLSSDVQDSLDSSSVLAEIAENLAVEDRIEDALRLAETITNLSKRERVVKRISQYASNIKRVA
jgi:tetratricopeptide (TPR) repeat protein